MSRPNVQTQGFMSQNNRRQKVLIMPTPVLAFELNPRTQALMQGFAWDPWTGEVFMSQNLGGTATGRETTRITRLSRPDVRGICQEISTATFTDAGHGTVVGIQRITDQVWIWTDWNHYDSTGTHIDLVRFRWQARLRPYTWTDHPQREVMPRFGNGYTIAQLDPTGEFIAYRISEGSFDRYELRRLGDVERHIDKVVGRAGPFPLFLNVAPIAERYTMQGMGTVLGHLWRYTGNALRTDPAALTEYSWKTGLEVARHDDPKDAGWLGPGTRWEPEGSAIIRSDIDEIKILYGITRGPANDRTHLVYGLTYDLALISPK